MRETQAFIKLADGRILTYPGPEVESFYVVSHLDCSEAHPCRDCSTTNLIQDLAQELQELRAQLANRPTTEGAIPSGDSRVPPT